MRPQLPATQNGSINIYGHLLPNVDAALADALGEMFDATVPQGEKVVALASS